LDTEVSCREEAERRGKNPPLPVSGGTVVVQFRVSIRPGMVAVGAVCLLETHGGTHAGIAVLSDGGGEETPLVRPLKDACHHA